MRGKLTKDIARRRETELLGSDMDGAVPLAPLLAKIARRPGRWRERMNGRLEWVEHQLDPFPEAA